MLGHKLNSHLVVRLTPACLPHSGYFSQYLGKTINNNVMGLRNHSQIGKTGNVKSVKFKGLLLNLHTHTHIIHCRDITKGFGSPGLKKQDNNSNNNERNNKNSFPPHMSQVDYGGSTICFESWSKSRTWVGWEAGERNCRQKKSKYR